jgi:flagellar hook assembly protein FlgD
MATVRTKALPTTLGQNLPNPFNPTTRIPFTTSERGHVTLAIYDATGRRVRTLIDGMMPAGRHDVDWDGRDDRGIVRSSGVYFCRMHAGKQSASRKMLLLK